tara:strand:+ start:1149 stop:1283 length:135 start_codon:yes stop_codon:yes gene_type:complete
MALFESVNSAYRARIEEDTANAYRMGGVPALGLTAQGPQTPANR